VRHGATEDEAARLDAGHLVDLAAGIRMHELVDGAAEGARIAQQRGDVAKHDPRLRIVRDGPDRVPQILVRRHLSRLLQRQNLTANSLAPARGAA